ncbi:hypothetical protein Hanom_Chr10g00941381 [Helianthus anomalus]
MYKLIKLSKSESIFTLWPDYVFLTRSTLASKFGFFGRSSGKLYRRLSLESRRTTKRAKLSGVTHVGAKT